MKSILLIIFIIEIFCTLNAQKSHLQSSLDSLAKSEMAFAKLSDEKGTKTAFVNFLTDDAIVLRPKPIKGKKFYEELKEDGSKLIWKPTFADISTDGKLGFTTGPWQFSIDSVKVFGHYVTIWQKQVNGDWKVILDAGIPHQVVLLDTFSLHLPNRLKENNIISTQFDRNGLSEIEKIISQKCEDSKSQVPLVQYFDISVKFYRNTYLPITGKKSVEKFINTGNEYYKWTVGGSNISDTDDLGYTYGLGEIISPSDSKKFSYLHIWKKQNNNWKIILDLFITY
jgi:ketosteroid isomerase-like protein